MDIICLDGAFFPSSQPLFTAANRGFKWGDGIFETIRVSRGQILLTPLHFERLFSSLLVMGMSKEGLSVELLSNLIIELCGKNNRVNARVRLALFRKEDRSTGFVIEAIAVPISADGWKEEGLRIGIYPFARKHADAFSNIKSANHLPYVLAGLYAEENNLDDALVLNARNHICDSSKANIFLIMGKDILTPALQEGCINGVMRRFLFEELKKMGYRLHAGTVSEHELLEADEMFLTNAVYGLRPVASFHEKRYPSIQSEAIYRELLSTNYSGAC